jgi:hypothetical protein
MCAQVPEHVSSFGEVIGLWGAGQVVQGIYDDEDERSRFSSQFGLIETDRAGNLRLFVKYPKSTHTFIQPELPAHSTLTAKIKELRSSAGLGGAIKILRVQRTGVGSSRGAEVSVTYSQVQQGIPFLHELQAEFTLPDLLPRSGQFAPCSPPEGPPIPKVSAEVALEKALVKSEDAVLQEYTALQAQFPGRFPELRLPEVVCAKSPELRWFDPAVTMFDAMDREPRTPQTRAKLVWYVLNSVGSGGLDWVIIDAKTGEVCDFWVGRSGGECKAGSKAMVKGFSDLGPLKSLTVRGKRRKVISSGSTNDPGPPEQGIRALAEFEKAQVLVTYLPKAGVLFSTRRAARGLVKVWLAP